jgi:hypothetical protein
MDAVKNGDADRGHKAGIQMKKIDAQRAGAEFSKGSCRGTALKNSTREATDRSHPCQQRIAFKISVAISIWSGARSP